MTEHTQLGVYGDLYLGSTRAGAGAGAGAGAVVGVGVVGDDGANHIGGGTDAIHLHGNQTVHPVGHLHHYFVPIDASRIVVIALGSHLHPRHLVVADHRLIPYRYELCRMIWVLAQALVLVLWLLSMVLLLLLLDEIYLALYRGKGPLGVASGVVHVSGVGAKEIHSEMGVVLVLFHLHSRVLAEG